MYRSTILRRTILELSSRQRVRRIPNGITTQIPLYLSFWKQYSVAPERNAPQGSGSTGKPPKSGSYLPKVVIVGVALGAAVFAAYQLNERAIEDHHNFPESAKIGSKNPVDLSNIIKDSREEKNIGEQNAIPKIQESAISSPNAELAEENIEPHSCLTKLGNIKEEGGETEFQANNKDQFQPEENLEPVQDKELLRDCQSNLVSQNEVRTSEMASEESLDMKGQEVKNIMEQPEKAESIPILAQDNTVREEKEMKSMPTEEQAAKDIPEDVISIGEEQPSSLLDAYHLRDIDEGSISTQSKKYKDLLVANEDSADVYVSKDGKLVLDFLQAIHAAEKRQADLDAHIFAEEKRKMKEKYEKELKDVRARELMHAEEAAILDKELKKERLKAASTLRSLKEELDEKLKMELEHKEAEAKSNLKRIQELAKAELAAALASEKASQIEKMAEANLHINALCMAFYARSEEARQSHSIHKLALGALALEDALSKGLPIQKEIDALHMYLKDIDKEPLLDLVLSSLPTETQSCGTDTLLQLRHKFDALKGTLRHFSLIPPGGGGMVTHSLAHVASWLKVREVDQSGDGIESVITRVESYLAEGRLPEAADTLENGIKGTQATEVVCDWVKRARNRAITEQALTLLQSYATSISLT